MGNWIGHCLDRCGHQQGAYALEWEITRVLALLLVASACSPNYGDQIHKSVLVMRLCE